MDNTEIQGQLSLTVNILRKVSDGNYGGTEASIFLQRDYDRNATPGEVEAVAKEAFLLAKTLVLDELGIQYTVENGVVAELTTTTAPVVTKTEGKTYPAKKSYPKKEAKAPVSAEEQAALEAIAEQFAGVEIVAEGVEEIGEVSETPILGADGKPTREWMLARVKVASDEFYDNRPQKAAGKYSPNSPDFKHKKTGTGLWLKAR